MSTGLDQTHAMSFEAASRDGTVSFERSPAQTGIHGNVAAVCDGSRRRGRQPDSYVTNSSSPAFSRFGALRASTVMTASAGSTNRTTEAIEASSDSAETRSVEMMLDAGGILKPPAVASGCWSFHDVVSAATSAMGDGATRFDASTGPPDLGATTPPDDDCISAMALMCVDAGTVSPGLGAFPPPVDDCISAMTLTCVDAGIMSPGLGAPSAHVGVRPTLAQRCGVNVHVVSDASWFATPTGAAAVTKFLEETAAATAPAVEANDKSAATPLPVIGLDTEWARDGTIAVLQLSSCSSQCFVLQLAAAAAGDDLTAPFRQRLEDERILKVGVNVQEDVKKLGALGITTRGLCDLAHLAVRAAEAATGLTGTGLFAITKMYTRFELNKDPSIRCSEWAARNLTQAQLDYAADDAVAGAFVFKEMWRRYAPALLAGLDQSSKTDNPVVDFVQALGKQPVMFKTTNAPKRDATAKPTTDVTPAAIGFVRALDTADAADGSLCLTDEEYRKLIIRDHSIAKRRELVVGHAEYFLGPIHGGKKAPTADALRNMRRMFVLRWADLVDRGLVPHSDWPAFTSRDAGCRLRYPAAEGQHLAEAVKRIAGMIVHADGVGPPPQFNGDRALPEPEDECDPAAETRFHATTMPPGSGAPSTTALCVRPTIAQQFGVVGHVLSNASWSLISQISTGVAAVQKILKGSAATASASEANDSPSRTSGSLPASTGP
jgi:hypothetical protein